MKAFTLALLALLSVLAARPYQDERRALAIRHAKPIPRLAEGVINLESRHMMSDERDPMQGERAGPGFQGFQGGARAQGGGAGGQGGGQAGQGGQGGQAGKGQGGQAGGAAGAQAGQQNNKGGQQAGQAGAGQAGAGKGAQAGKGGQAGAGAGAAAGGGQGAAAAAAASAAAASSAAAAADAASSAAAATSAAAAAAVTNAKTKGKGKGAAGGGAAAAAAAAASSSSAAAAAASASAADAAAAANAKTGGKGGNNKNNAGTTTTNAASATTALPKAEGTATIADENGQTGTPDPSLTNNGGTSLSKAVINDSNAGNPTDGEVVSATSNNNYLDFCDGKTLTNGLQNTAGSCNPIPMGDIPSVNNMVTSLITSPANGAKIKANSDIDVAIAQTGLDSGSFTDAQATYYSGPQQLNKDGNINGHMHVVVQALDSATTAPDATNFEFFQGLRDGTENGQYTFTIAGGLPAGSYRLCTMSSASNHQAVTMPVAQRGPQDDCIRMTVQ